MPNPFVHVELMSTDVGKAKSFYGKLFDWELEDVPINDMTYTMDKVGEGTGGGLMKNPIPNAPSSWVAYVLVDDLKRAVEKAKALGATVMKDETQVKGRGLFAIIEDPTGAMLGLWESTK
jgi:predicted enzyme related to lactoylglutathione lyase